MKRSESSNSFMEGDIVIVKYGSKTYWPALIRNKHSSGVLDVLAKREFKGNEHIIQYFDHKKDYDVAREKNLRLFDNSRNYWNDDPNIMRAIDEAYEFSELPEKERRKNCNLFKWSMKKLKAEILEGRKTGMKKYRTEDDQGLEFEFYSERKKRKIVDEESKRKLKPIKLIIPQKKKKERKRRKSLKRQTTKKKKKL